MDEDGNNHFEQDQGGNFAHAPSLSLPKGGGAIRGIGEKFTANPVTGTGSMQVPIATSPGRAEFGPQLSLAYDSGAGNGIFGLGWSLSLPSITRKTDKGLPRYLDDENSDEYILSNVEDLVPVLIEDEQNRGNWIVSPFELRTVGRKKYKIRRYRPRIESLFANIERWTNSSDPADVFWRSISSKNITTWYGLTSESRIADPANPAHIFSWLICQSHDDKGNAVIYEYKPEDSTGVNRFQPHERNRSEASRSAHRYIKSIRYGNTSPFFPVLKPDQPITPPPSDWLFEVVFDYGEHHRDTPAPNDTRAWTVRHDPFSTYRAGFEIRTYRLCRRVLMFHHFPDEPEIGENALVGSTDLTFRNAQPHVDEHNPIHCVLISATQCGYRKKSDGTYLKKTMPAVDFEYSQVTLGKKIKAIPPDSRENLPYGVDGTGYQWVDLDGEGLTGILTEQGGAWFYKRNKSQLTSRIDRQPADNQAQFEPIQMVGSSPAGGLFATGQRQFLDLAGDGRLDLVALAQPLAGFYERRAKIAGGREQGWETFTPFKAQPNIPWSDPNLRFIDLTGDGRADVLISEEEIFTWYPSLAQYGFGQHQRVGVPVNEAHGPRILFSDAEQTLFQGDFSGDGLTDIVRIRNGDVCYWPNLGYGRFGAKVTMDHAPWMDTPDQFDPRRIRLADIDGSGVADIIYLGSGETRFWFNQSGNGWSASHLLEGFPPADNINSVSAIDLLGNGTACLVWSTPAASDAQSPMRYIELMAEGKPHLLTGVRNNMGAETRVRYAPSTYFYLADKQAGTPWITRLPFPVHVVDRVETYDHISKNRFVTRYAYHHGYFDGVEREFRGFGMVEQYDTEEFAILNADGKISSGENIDFSSHVPPILTRTWFHTGAYNKDRRISNFFAGLLDADDRGEYYREPGLTDEKTRDLLLDDTVLPNGLTTDEQIEACRALKGSMIRQEVYSLDATEKQGHPYTVTEQNFRVRLLQPKADNRHGVFFTHAFETITYHYERNPADPRITHTMTLQVDNFGNILKDAAIGYGRRLADNKLSASDRAAQARTLITYTENRVTNAVKTVDQYRTPLLCETSTYELTGYTPTGPAGRFRHSDFVQTASGGVTFIYDGELNYEEEVTSGRKRRLIKRHRTFFRPDDLGASPKNDPMALLPFATIASRALLGERYQLAFTPGLLKKVYRRKTPPRKHENLLPEPDNVLPAEIPSQQIADRGGYIDLDENGHWWVPSGRVFYSPNTGDCASSELAYARRHFFLGHRYCDPFGESSSIAFDNYDLLMVKTRDALNNQVRAQNDYRVLQPDVIIDLNRNRTAVAFDTLAMVVGTAVMGRAGEKTGDSLDGFEADLTESVIRNHMMDPLADPHAILKRASSRLVYDLFAYQRSKDRLDPQPATVYSIVRETHDADLASDERAKIQPGFSYSDGFGREIQKKIPAEPGPVPRRDAAGNIIADGGGTPKPTQHDVSPRWVGSGWTVFNNKGNPVRQYEPFFSDTHRYEFNLRIGVSPVIFYDPAQRVVGTLHPNHTWEKVVFDPWRKETWDVNDTVSATDPGHDIDVGDFFRRLPDSDYRPAWFSERNNGGLGRQEKEAARNTLIHAGTPTIVHFDSLGRDFLTVVHNKRRLSVDASADAVEEQFYQTRIRTDIEGNRREVIDARQRIVMRYEYNMLGSRIHQMSMEAGQRWMLNDVVGNPIRAWDSRGHRFRTRYDPIRRPVESFLKENDNGDELMVERTVYGESRLHPLKHNLRGKVVEVFDQAGILTNDEYDFKGNLIASRRQLATEYKTTLDWSAAIPLEPDAYNTRTRYDALNRPIALTAPDGSTIGLVYNEASLLESIGVRLQGNPGSTSFVNNIDYDAKGQRTRIDYGNGASTRYEYDPLTFRLVHLVTRRDAAHFPEDCLPSPSDRRKGCQVRNLFYTYDPVGNITHIRDNAQQTIFFRNHRIAPSNSFVYDALYRLIQATGREHLGQNLKPLVHSYKDSQREELPHPSDGTAMGRYVEQYMYDAVGNILSMQHRGSQPDHPGWTQNYTYNETSQLETGKTNNRLSATIAGDSQEPYRYDDSAGAHGNMTAMPHLPLMLWDYRDQLQATSRQVQSNGGVPEKTWYVYNSGGRRVRKITDRRAAAGQLPKRKNERIYLGGFEIYRKYGNDGVSRTLKRETLHVMDDKQRVALVERQARGGAETPSQRICYQLSNHLGSAGLELDDRARIISYEEYTPYGSTSFQTVRNQTESSKRYRFTGKERDESSGLYYHGARYYAPWLGRWTACDPGGIAEGENLYVYVRNRPLIAIDPNGRWINIVVGAVAGAVIGAGVELARQAISGEELDWGRVAAASAGGAVGGAIAGATFGASLAVEAAGVAVGAAVGGTTTRMLNDEPTTAKDVAFDVTVGLVTFGALRGAGAALSRSRGSAAGRGAGRGSGRRGGNAAGPRPPKPTPPPNRKLGEAIGWGKQQAPAAARQSARSVTRDQLRQNGVTREWLEQWRSFYRFFEQNAEHFPNPTAPGRAAFLDEVLNRLFPQPAAVASGAGPGVAAGIQSDTENATEGQSPAPQSEDTSASLPPDPGGTSSSALILRRNSIAPSPDLQLRLLPSFNLSGPDTRPLLPNGYDALSFPGGMVPMTDPNAPATVPLFELRFRAP